MRVVGIDPGLATSGVAFLDRQGEDLIPLSWMTIRTPRGAAKADRLIEIASDLKKLLRQYKPDVAVVEKLYFETNVKTAMDVAEARGVILLTVAQEGIPLLEPTPLEVKLAVTGDGKADKQQVADMLVRTLELDEPPTPDDAADALTLAVYGAVVRRGDGVGDL